MYLCTKNDAYMEKDYKFSLTDEEIMHVLLAVDAWSSGQRKKAAKAHERKDENADKFEKRYSTASHLIEKMLLEVTRENPTLDLHKMWEEIMFDV